jgi:predicted nuclease with TOPRIM domain|tara:strand:+ start:270 stop:527 length:258 start_codon:yes stop_codon:yes gene_type:complete
MAEQETVAKISEKQLKDIKKIQGDLNQVLNQIGYLEVQKSGLKTQFAKINEDSEKFKKELEDEYGPINIDLATGEYTIVEPEEKK